MPDSVRQSAPCCSATTRYIAKIIAAGELIVIDVVMSPSGMPSNSVSMSASDATLTPHFPTSPSDSGWSRIAAHQRRQIEGDAQAGAAGGEQRLVARVGVFRRAEPRKLPHRPQLAAVAGGVDAARVRKLAGIAQVARVVHVRDALGGVQAIDRAPGDRREVPCMLGRGFHAFEIIAHEDTQNTKGGHRGTRRLDRSLTSLESQR